ncbi:amino acid oxidase [Streptomonospora alba]|uniref:Amino acid oxidase n=1 Tax=Streptomonospora alba TaxID=183763 RepID=A0A0C2G303_9ACTN|nr:FAD-dependent oxidoreductase [Streptomonospora alba]KIH97658.1 amino acid oxidase [Streptomonospora alba]
MSELRRHIDVAVIGAGVLGLAATDALARRGAEVVCFEGRRPGQGQSGGLTRTFRNRHDDEDVVRLVADSLALWRDWEKRCGRTLVGSEGTAYLGFGESDAAGLDTHGIAHRWVEGELAPEVFGPLRPVSGRLLVDPDSGAIRSRRTIEALTSWVGDRIVSEEVHGVCDPGDGGGVELQTADAIYRARHVLICAGAATPRLAAGVGIDIPLEAALHARPHFRVRDEHASGPLPCWVDRSGEFGPMVYGSPIGTTGRYVIGMIGKGVDVPMDGGLPPGTEMEEHVRRLSRYVERALPGLHPEPVGIRVCSMTKLPAGSDAIGVWHTDGVTAVTGHNLFKMAPVLGELLADGAQENRLAGILARCTDRATQAA